MILALVALLAAACGNGDGEETTDATADPAATATAPASPGAAPAGEMQFDVPESPIRVTYEVSGAPEGQSEVVFSFDAPRFALRTGVSAFIDTGEEDGVIACTPPTPPGGPTAPPADGEATCFRVPEAQIGPAGAIVSAIGGLAPLFGIAQSLAEEGEVEVGGEVTEREIAGRQALCTTVEDQPDLGVERAEICADVETGVALRFDVTGQQDFEQTIEAIEVGEPQPEDFEPMAEVQDAPPAPPQPGGGSPPPTQ